MSVIVVCLFIWICFFLNMTCTFALQTSSVVFSSNRNPHCIVSNGFNISSYRGLFISVLWCLHLHLHCIPLLFFFLFFTLSKIYYRVDFFQGLKFKICWKKITNLYIMFHLSYALQILISHKEIIRIRITRKIARQKWWKIR